MAFKRERIGGFTVRYLLDCVNDNQATTYQVPDDDFVSCGNGEMQGCSVRTVLYARVDVHFDADQEKDAVHVVVGDSDVKVVPSFVVKLKTKRSFKEMISTDTESIMKRLW